MSFQMKTRPRMLQATLYTLAWSQNGQRAVGEIYTYGRSKGRVCFSKQLKIGLCRYMNIKHKQAVRYLNGLKNHRWIETTNQYNIEGKLEYRISPAVSLIPGERDKYFRFNLRGTGRKGFDILNALEQALIKDSHPDEQNSKQLKFIIPERTRRWRQSRHKKRQKKPVRQKVTPIVNNNPLPFYRKEVKTTLASQKTPKGYFYIKLPKQEKLKIPWSKLKRLSEHQKVCSGITTSERAVWFRGKVCVWNPYFSVYEHKPKPPKTLCKSHPAKSDSYRGHSGEPVFPSRRDDAHSGSPVFPCRLAERKKAELFCSQQDRARKNQLFKKDLDSRLKFFS